MEHDEHDSTRRPGRMPASHPPPSPAEREAFVQSVLARTSGRACDRAEGHLGDYVDGHLDHDDAGLVAEHLEHCMPCRAVARTIAEMRAPLRRMAAIDPGPDFTAAVVQATTGAGARERALAPLRTRPRALALAPVALWTRWCAIWQALVARPRFALEAAYVGTVLLVLLVGMPRSPLRGLPARAMELAELNPVRAVTELVSGLRGTTGGDDATRLDSVAAWPRRQARDIGTRWRRVQAAAERLEAHGGQVVRGLRQRSTPQVGHGLRAIADDLTLLWNGARGSGPTDQAQPGEPDAGDATTGRGQDHDDAPGHDPRVQHEDDSPGSRSAAPPVTREDKESRP
ncbi:MAG: hypothetical protein PVF43_08335 [Candidatus Eiseniibacteriota bacterium]